MEMKEILIASEEKCLMVCAVCFEMDVSICAGFPLGPGRSDAKKKKNEEVYEIVLSGTFQGF